MSKPALTSNMELSTLTIPAHMVGLVSADWLARLPLVQSEIQNRRKSATTENEYSFRARLWNRWIFRNVPEVTA